MNKRFLIGLGNETSTTLNDKRRAQASAQAPTLQVHEITLERYRLIIEN